MVEIRVRGVKKATAKGRVYYYHRRTGKRLQADFGTPAFLEEVAILDGLRSPRESRHGPGTLGGLVDAYRASPEFLGLKPATRKDYQDVFDYLEPMAPMALIQLDADLVLGIRDKAYRKHKRRFANYIVQVLRLLCSWGRPRKWIRGDNPAAGIALIARPKDAPVINRPWTAAEVAAVLAAASPEIRVAVAIGLYAGLRQGDVLRLQWSAYDGTAIETRQGKTGEMVWVPVHRALRAIFEDARNREQELAAARAAAGKPVVRATTIVIGKRGRPYTESGFRTVFYKLVAALKEEGKVGPGLTFHGLRHTIGTALADEGFDSRTIIAVTGHKNEAMAKVYTDTADRKRRATTAIRRLERAEKKAAGSGSQKGRKS